MRSYRPAGRLLQSSQPSPARSSSLAAGPTLHCLMTCSPPTGRRACSLHDRVCRYGPGCCRFRKLCKHGNLVATTQEPTLNSPTRRRFLEIVPVAGTALIAACSPAPAPAPAPSVSAAPPPAAPAPAAPAPAAPVPAAPPPVTAPAAGTPPPAAPSAGNAALVDEKDPQAVALSYVSDASRVDKAKFPAYVAGSQCSTCALYQGAAADATGPCPLFQGKRVQAGGWCMSWTKKA